MKKYIYLILLMVLSNISHAQIISNKYSIYLSYSIGNYPGSERINEDNFITPSLYSNYEMFSGFSLKGFFNTKGLFSYGINYDYQSADNWTTTDYLDFNNSEIHLHSITPIVRTYFRSGAKEPANKIRIYLEGGIPIGISKLNLSRSPFDVYPYYNNPSPPISDKNIFAGLRGTTGLVYSVNQRLGLHCSYSYDINWVSSILYNDKFLKRSIFNVGMVLRLKKNKYFYY